MIMLVGGLLLLGARDKAATGEPGNLRKLSWLTGCWEAQSPGRSVEEHWLPPRGKSMIGVSRTVQADTLREYELVIIRELAGGQIAFEANPSGQASAVFMARSVSDSAVVFENPIHDFPQQIGYSLRGDSLVAWIEGEKGGKFRRVEFPYARARCP